jgi:hypothetical protein
MKTFYNFLKEEEAAPPPSPENATPGGLGGLGGLGGGLGSGSGLGPTTGVSPTGGLGSLGGLGGPPTGGLGGPNLSSGSPEPGGTIDPNQNKQVNIVKIKSYNVWDALQEYLSKSN